MILLYFCILQFLSKMCKNFSHVLPYITDSNIVEIVHAQHFNFASKFFFKIEVFGFKFCMFWWKFPDRKIIGQFSDSPKFREAFALPLPQYHWLLSSRPPPHFCCSTAPTTCCCNIASRNCKTYKTDTVTVNRYNILRIICF